MDVAAILAIRNDGPYVANCLTYLKEEGIFYAVIDNDSTDDVAATVRQLRFRSHLVDYSRLPFTGTFELARQLEAKEDAAARVGAEWVINHDIDEVMHSYRPDQTLLEAIVAADAAGSTAINFDEFVFLPLDTDYVPDHQGWQPMGYYYYFEEQPLNLLRAQRIQDGFSVLNSGGHRIESDSVRVSTETLALRHYIFRSTEHAYTKYASRVFSGRELEKNWHHDRVGQPAEAFRLPPASSLKRLSSPDQQQLDRSDRKSTHYWQWPSC